MDVTIHQKTTLTRRRGVEYLKLLDTKTNIEIEEAVTQLDGLFGGDDTLGISKKKKFYRGFLLMRLFVCLPVSARATNRVINENALEFFKELKPVVEHIVTKITENLLMSAVNTIPYANLYPKSH